jgi:hypothetical protein
MKTYFVYDQDDVLVCTLKAASQDEVSKIMEETYPKLAFHIVADENP